jgi:hypothetical protein
MKTDVEWTFNLGDWITLKEENIEKMREGYEDKDEFNRRYKYATKVINISHNSASYPIYYMEPSSHKTVSPELYRLATKKEIKIAKLKGCF